MAKPITDSIDSSPRIQWMWNASIDPFSKSHSSEWKPYSDVETMIIEEAFQVGHQHAVLDTYTIDFKHNIQVLNHDLNKQRPVRRVVRGKDEIPVRADRFTYTPTNPKRPFAGLYGWISPFIRETVKYLNISKDHLPSKNKSAIPMIVDKAAAGIIEEGKKLGRQCEGEKMARKLLATRDAGMEEVWKCCASLYSMESFLYTKMNEVMRLIGDKDYENVWRDKARTLGPFCLLLWDNPNSDKPIPRGTVLYRGANLSEQLISIFKEECWGQEKPMRSFPSFSSCTRNRKKAEEFGNVLFIMNAKHVFSVDLKPFSHYPDEEEELVSPGVCFTVDRVEFDGRRQKYLIDLTLTQQYRRKLPHIFYVTAASLSETLCL